MLPRASDRMEQTEFALQLRRVGLTDLGPYTCQAYGGQGAPASFTVIARAMGPVAPATNAQEQAYMRYVVNAPQTPAAGDLLPDEPAGRGLPPG